MMRSRFTFMLGRTVNPHATIAAVFVAALVGCGERAGRAPQVGTPAPSAEAILVDRGRMIYLRGESVSGRPISARIGDGPELPATTLACVQCHGVDGRGRTEGGITPSDIQWEKLVRPSGPDQASARRRPAYTDALLARAITMGWDSSGQSLLTAMPRYKFTPADLSALFAYLKKVGSEPVPGVSESAIRIGVVLPEDSNVNGHRDEIVRPLSEYFRRINESGGIFRRRLELTVVETTLGVDENVFAVLGGFAADGDRRLAEIETGQVPTVRVYAEAVQLVSNDRRNSFALVPGYADQVRSLVRFAIERQLGFSAGIAVLPGDGDLNLALAKEATRELSAAGARLIVLGAAPTTSDGRASLKRQLRKQRIAAVLLAGGDNPGAMEALAAMTVEQPESMVILAPESVGSRWLAAPRESVSGTLFIATAVPSWLGSSDSRALAAGKILTEGLRRAGRDLDRESFISGIEQVSLGGPGDAVPIAFGPGRHIGIRGTSIVRLALRRTLASRATETVVDDRSDSALRQTGSPKRPSFAR
jgi:ABC-type branched-subunit amino acid transport system substrate-binding protein